MRKSLELIGLVAVLVAASASVYLAWRVNVSHKVIGKVSITLPNGRYVETLQYEGQEWSVVLATQVQKEIEASVSER